jgi:hypothetical protein
VLGKAILLLRDWAQRNTEEKTGSPPKK